MELKSATSTATALAFGYYGQAAVEEAGFGHLIKLHHEKCWAQLANAELDNKPCTLAMARVFGEAAAKCHATEHTYDMMTEEFIMCQGKQLAIDKRIFSAFIDTVKTMPLLAIVLTAAYVGIIQETCKEFLTTLHGEPPQDCLAEQVFPNESCEICKGSGLLPDSNTCPCVAPKTDQMSQNETT